MRIYDEKKLNFNESSELILGRIEIKDNDIKEKLIEICSAELSNSDEKKIDINSVIIGGYLDLNSIEYEYDYDSGISDRVESAKLNMFLKCEINVTLNDGFEYSDEVYLESNDSDSYRNMMSMLGL